MIQNASFVFKAAKLVHEAEPEMSKLRQATDGLEGFMFKTLLQSMGGTKGLFGSNVPGGDIYKDMLEQNLSDLLAKRSSVNIGDTMFKKVAPQALSQIQTRLQIEQRQAKTEIKA